MQETVLLLTSIISVHRSLSGCISDKAVEKILQAENREVQTQVDVGFLNNRLFLGSLLCIVSLIWRHFWHIVYTSNTSMI